jgi:hypothetical protein
VNLMPCPIPLGVRIGCSTRMRLRALSAALKANG